MLYIMPHFMLFDIHLKPKISLFPYTPNYPLCEYIPFTARGPLFMIAAMCFGYLTLEMFHIPLNTEWELTKSPHTTCMAITITQF